jgi:hypothetical protein
MLVKPINSPNMAEDIDGKKIHPAINLNTKEIIFAKAINEHSHHLTHVEDVLNRENHRKGKLLINRIADTHDLYDLTASYQKELLTRPRKGARPFTGSKSRQSHVNLIRALGGHDVARGIWAKLTG